MVRGRPVKEALNILKFAPKKGADILYKVVHSAAYNAKNNFKTLLPLHAALSLLNSHLL
jgi:ribosomal protein L22